MNIKAAISLLTCPEIADVDALILGTNQAWRRSKSFHTSTMSEEGRCQM